jgi:hypothetical protein
MGMANAAHWAYVVGTWGSAVVTALLALVPFTWAVFSKEPLNVETKIWNPGESGGMEALESDHWDSADRGDAVVAGRSADSTVDPRVHACCT